jgi:hypothetical protein
MTSHPVTHYGLLHFRGAVRQYCQVQMFLFFSNELASRDPEDAALTSGSSLCYVNRSDRSMNLGLMSTRVAVHQNS